MSTDTQASPSLTGRHVLLQDLIETPSPTGSEQAIQRLIYDRFKSIAHHIEPDVVGNLTLSLNPDAKRTVMLCGHCDQIGFLVKHVSDDGYLYLDSLGGTDSGVMLGEHLTIHAKKGPLNGIVGRKPVHMQKGPEMQQIPVKDKIWVDIGCTDRNQALDLVEIGNYATFVPRILKLQNDFIAGPGMDDKAGLYVCLEVFRQCAGEGCDVGLYVVSTVQEEIGSRGAQTATNRIAPDVGIAVDTAPATDDPGYDLPPQHHVACKLGSGPSLSLGPNTNPMVGKMLLDAATREELPYQIDPSGSTMPNDSRAIQVGDSGVAAATVSIPQRNMHTQVEVISLSDLDNAVRLLVAFIRSITDQTDFRPFYFRR
jgi:putative aminopeptidase FrvX